MRLPLNCLPYFAAISAFSELVNTIAVIPSLLFFGIAIIHYINLGLTTGSNNSLRDSTDKAKDYLILNVLAISEIGGFSVLWLVSLSTIMGLRVDARAVNLIAGNCRSGYFQETDHIKLDRQSR